MKGGKNIQPFNGGDTHAVDNLHENYSSHNVLFACLWFSSSTPCQYSCWVPIFVSVSFLVLFIFYQRAASYYSLLLHKYGKGWERKKSYESRKEKRKWKQCKRREMKDGWRRVKAKGDEPS